MSHIYSHDLYAIYCFFLGLAIEHTAVSQKNDTGVGALCTSWTIAPCDLYRVSNAHIMSNCFQDDLGIWEIFLPNNADGSPPISHGSRVKVVLSSPCKLLLAHEHEAPLLNI